MCTEAVLPLLVVKQENNMSVQRIVGIVLVVVGVVLVIVGMNASESIVDQTSEVVRGRFTDSTMWYIIGGIATGLLGLGLAIFSPRKITQ
jgi:capsule polysaccharide export protein KpsE/RkpR